MGVGVTDQVRPQYLWLSGRDPRPRFRYAHGRPVPETEPVTTMRLMTQPDDVAIHNLVFAYPEYVGAGDADGVGHLFRHGQLSADGSPKVSRGRAEVSDTFRAVVDAAGARSHLHNVVTNLLVEVEPDGRTATCRSRFTVFGGGSGLPLQAVLAGRYQDRFARIDGEWCFTDRHIVIDLTSDFGEVLRDTARPSPAG
jgi:hypothetical protein